MSQVRTTRSGRTALSTVVALSLVLSSSGCTKRVPVEDGAFESTQRVVVTLANDREVRGKIDIGGEVAYTESGIEYRAEVGNVNDDQIVLTDLVKVQTYGSRQEVVERLADSRMYLAEPREQVILSRQDIQKVERVRADGSRIGRSVGFWATAGIVTLLILGERS